ncbi:MAG: hypothetical protein GY870_22670 [archaeon]|nr:hypothetical protein [archaeon]
MKTFKQFLTETITVPIRDIWKYFPKRMKELKGYVKQLQKLNHDILKFEEHWNDEFKWHLDKFEHQFYPEQIVYFLRPITGSSYNPTETLDQTFWWAEFILGAEKITPEDYTRFVTDLEVKVNRVKEYDYFWDALDTYFNSQIWDGYLKGWSDDGKLNGDDLKIYKMLLEIIKIRSKIVVMLETMHKKAEARKKEIYYIYDKVPPHTENIEPLYHASFHASNIYKNGFSKNYDLSKNLFGLGGGSIMKNNSLSFTYDLNIARSIATVFKDIWNIANGKMTMIELLRWIKKEKVEKDVKDHYNMQRKNTDWDNLTLHPTPEETLEVFQYFLNFSKTRVNPWFGVSLQYRDKMISQLKKLKYRDIGIVQAEVNVSGSDVEFLPGEREYRVKPERVVKMLKLIR